MCRGAFLIVAAEIEEKHKYDHLYEEPGAAIGRAMLALAEILRGIANREAEKQKKLDQDLNEIIQESKY